MSRRELPFAPPEAPGRSNEDVALRLLGTRPRHILGAIPRVSILAGYVASLDSYSEYIMVGSGRGWNGVIAAGNPKLLALRCHLS